VSLPTLFRAIEAIPELSAAAGDYVAIYTDAIHVLRCHPRIPLGPAARAALELVPSPQPYAQLAG
jgi:hypothetical protein